MERERATRQVTAEGSPEAAAPAADAGVGGRGRTVAGAGNSTASASRASVSEQAVMREVQTLYANHDEYSLKEGQTIK